MRFIQLFKSKWADIDPFGVVVPSLSVLVFPFVLAKAMQVHWLCIVKYAPLGTLLTAVFAFLTYRRNLVLENDRVLSQKAREALEHAFDAFNGATQNNRDTWLETSRMIIRFKKLKEAISYDSYRVACQIEEDYWRHKFFTKISGLDLNAILNTSSDVANGKAISIFPKSAMVVLDFSKMKDDPVDEVDVSRIVDKVWSEWGVEVKDYILKTGLKCVKESGAEREWCEREAASDGTNIDTALIH